MHLGDVLRATAFAVPGLVDDERQPEVLYSPQLVDVKGFPPLAMSGGTSASPLEGDEDLATIVRSPMNIRLNEPPSSVIVIRRRCLLRIASQIILLTELDGSWTPPRYTAREARQEVCSRLMASSAALTKAAQSNSLQTRLDICTSIALNSALATA